MSINALRSQGTVIARGNGDGPPETFTDISEVTTIQGPGGSTAEIEVSDLSSTAKEFVPGLKDNGQLTLGMQFRPGDAGQQQIIADKASGATSNWRITFPDTTEVVFPAYVQEATPSVGVDEAAAFDVTLRIAGDETWTFAP